MCKDNQDRVWMQQALELAHFAGTQNEIPVGAVLVKNNKLIAAGCNQPIASQDPTAHAEIVVLREAAKQLGYRLVNTTLYTTLEPCAMCLGAMIHARVARLVFAATDPKAGAVVSVFNLLDENKFNHRIEYSNGLYAKEAAQLLQDFFKQRRFN